MKDKVIKVLLIEDNPGDARLIQEMLNEVKDNSFVLECATKLSRGLESIAGEHIDIILSDLSLPDSQGLDTLVRVHSQASDVPIIVLTNLDDEDLAIMAMQKGAQDYLIKDQVDSNLLVRSIHYAIERYRLLKELEQARQREQQNREIQSLEQISGSPSMVTAGTYGMKPLIESSPEIFNELVQYYGNLLDQALKQQNYRVDYDFSEKLNILADQLGLLRVGPRDVVQIHTMALKEKNRDAPYKKTQAYIEEGRLMVLELMGNIVSFYRNYFLNVKKVPERKTQKENMNQDKKRVKI